MHGKSALLEQGRHSNDVKDKKKPSLSSKFKTRAGLPFSKTEGLFHFLAESCSLLGSDAYATCWHNFQDSLP